LKLSSARRPSGASRDLFFDTVTLSNFALARRVDLLVDRYGQRARITQEVRNEVLEGIVAGYPALGAIEVALEEERLGAAGNLTAEERRIYRELLRSLGPGEASCVAWAKARGGTVVTDDRAARGACGERDVLVTGTIGILKACVQDGTLEAEEADATLELMIDDGYYSPVRRVSDLL
jgi:predicted nucleic acid-binding protein